MKKTQKQIDNEIARNADNAKWSGICQITEWNEYHCNACGACPCRYTVWVGAGPAFCRKCGEEILKIAGIPLRMFVFEETGKLSFWDKDSGERIA